MILLTLTYTSIKWFHMGTEASQSHGRFRIHDPNTCPGNGSHQTAGALTHSATMLSTATVNGHTTGHEFLSRTNLTKTWPWFLRLSI